MLELQGVRAGYGRINILDDVTLKVRDGERLGVLGHNGMGKTTLLRAIIGEIPLGAGELRWQGESIASLPTHRRARLGLGYVPQGRQIFPALTVLENLRFAAAGADAGTVDAVIEDFPRLRPLLDRQGGLLSGGEQQILALARCLCGRPRVMLLDEPTEGIQPSIIDEIAGVLEGLRRRGGLTVVLVEQNLDFLRALSDRIILLEKGRITRSASLSDASAVESLIEAAGFAEHD
ncbi:MAG TPA: ABC transporter ATP-binding protein [Burkholderiaceae bacterium]|nr:ABC transporter ATP-binding protein [Burkholderiaceae bacterium]